MNKILGLAGFLILIVSGVYLDAPFIGLLASLFFLAGYIFLLVFYLGLLRKQKSHKVFYIFLVVLGVTLLCGVLGYAAVEYNQFQVIIDRTTSGEKIPFNWRKILVVIAVNIVAAFSIYFGIRNSEKINDNNILIVWMPTLISVPFTLLLLKLAVVNGFWFGG